VAVELLDAIAAPAERRISVRSGHGVGKSTAVAMAAVWHVLMRIPSKTVVTAPTSSQLFDACFAEMKNVAKRLKPPFNDLLEIK
jgi:phage terminase large subunit